MATSAIMENAHVLGMISVMATKTAQMRVMKETAVSSTQNICYAVGML